MPIDTTAKVNIKVLNAEDILNKYGEQDIQAAAQTALLELFATTLNNRLQFAKPEELKRLTDQQKSTILGEFKEVVVANLWEREGGAPRTGYNPGFSAKFMLAQSIGTYIDKKYCPETPKAFDAAIHQSVDQALLQVFNLPLPPTLSSFRG